MAEKAKILNTRQMQTSQYKEKRMQADPSVKIHQPMKTGRRTTVKGMAAEEE